MDIDTFAIYNDGELPPDRYSPLTWAWDLNDSTEKARMFHEAERLKEKDVDVCIKLWDNHDGTHIRVTDETVTDKCSVWGEIWTAREEN